MQIDTAAAALPADIEDLEELAEDAVLAEADEIVEDGESLAFDGEEQ